MRSVDEVIDSYSGMITREQASTIANGADDPPGESISVAGLREFIRAAKSKGKVQESYKVTIEDNVYRVFNEVRQKAGLRDFGKRTLTLGNEGETINITLSDRVSSQVDVFGVERGDILLVKDATFVAARDELKSERLTTISRMRQSLSGIADYSKMEDSRNVDVIGKVTEIYPLRYVNQIGKQGQTPVADCKITDMRNTANVTLWGSCALLAARMNIGDFIKIEFCAARLVDSKVYIQASDLSRILISKSLEGRLPLAKL